MNAVEAKKGLGRGLASLLGDEGQDYAALDKLRQSKNVPIEMITPGKFQPRKTFDSAELESLADSIRGKGILQPLLVRRDPAQSNRYELIAGERRWRAAQIAQLHEVPVVIKEMTDQDALEIALIENIQRQDLTAIEEAEAYSRLMKEFGHTQEEMADALGKSRSYIANTLRLLQLPQDVREMVSQGSLSAGHARTLLSSENPSEMAKEIVEKSLNVRQVEEMTKAQKSGGKVVTIGRAAKPGNQNQPGNAGADANTRDLEKQLSNILGMRVSIQFSGKAGTLAVHYQGLDQLDDLIARLSKK